MTVQGTDGNHLKKTATRRTWLVLLLVSLQACAVRSPYDDVSDPLQPLNRVVYRFNDTVDRHLVRPVAERYREYVPSVVQTGVLNFFGNLYEPIVIVNDLLQWKPGQFASDTMRFGFNTIFGVGGLIDVGTPWGLPHHQEDFGQTFGVWGFGEGWYLVLPLIGPSTVRDTAGLPLSWSLDPVQYRPNPWERAGWYTLFAVSRRAELLSASRVLDAGSVDAYLQVREAYRQQRWYDIHDGDPPEPDFLDEELFSD
ncbi:MAG TPA: VacJ family lipoprotein [Gammaproteobacteria bacterium]|nr:VacJ family lipoprotein [Gammaproteobacteria bacterium]